VVSPNEFLEDFVDEAFSEVPRWEAVIPGAVWNSRLSRADNFSSVRWGCLDVSFLFWLPCPLTATSSVPWEYFLLEEAFDDEFELADGLVMEMPESLFMELDFLLEFSEWLLVLLRAPPEWSLRLELL